MAPIIRHVRDLEASERCVLEHVLGRQLQDDQQILLQVVTADKQPAEGQAPSLPGKLPDWCNVFEGLTGEQLAEAEQAILQRSNLTRPSP